MPSEFISINISQTLHSECQRTKHHLSNLLRWNQSLCRFKKRKKNPEIFPLYKPLLHIWGSPLRGGTAQTLRDLRGGDMRVQNKGQRSWCLQSRDRDWWVRSSWTGIWTQGLGDELGPTRTMCWMRDWNFVDGAAAVSAAPARPAAGTGLTSTACGLTETHSSLGWWVLQRKQGNKETNH